MGWVLALLLGLGNFQVGANSGNDAGVFVLDSRTGTAKYFGADMKRFGQVIRFQGEAGAPGTYAMSVNSGSLGGVFIVDTRNGLTRYFKVDGKQVGPNLKPGSEGKSGPVGTFAVSANSGDRGGVFLLDTRTGTAELLNTDGIRVGEPIKFGGDAGGSGRYALGANSGRAEGVFILDTRDGLCRYFHTDGKRVGEDIRFDSGPPAGAANGRFALSVNSGESGGVFIADTRTGLCRFFHVTGKQFGRDIRGAGEDPKDGRFAVSANSGEAGGVFVLDSMTGVARFFGVPGAGRIGKDISFPESAVFHKAPGRFALSANSGSWGGVFIQDTESGVVRLLTVQGKKVGKDLTD